MCSCSNYKEKLSALQKELGAKEYEIEKLQSQNLKLQTEFEDLQKKQIDYVKLDYLQGFLPNSHVLDKKKLAKCVFDCHDLNNSDVNGYNVIDQYCFYTNYDSEYENSSYSTRYGNTMRNFCFSFLWQTLDRNADNIRDFLSTDDKDYICSLFENNDVYFKSGLYDMAKGLLLAYKQLISDPDLLEEMHSVLFDGSDTGKLILFDLTSDVHNWSFVDEEMLEVLESSGFEESRWGSKVMYMYSFWTRRYHEGNMDVVYDLIKEFHGRLSMKAEYIDGLDGFSLSSVPDSLAGCSSVFALSKEDYQNDSIIYFDDMGETCLVSMANQIVRLGKKSETSYGSDDFTVCVKNKEPIGDGVESTEYNADIEITNKKGYSILIHVYGVCGC